MSGKEGETSPVRVSRVPSRLKKRRRPIKECALQRLPAAPLQTSRHSGASRCANGNNFDCKENTLNGLSFASGKESTGRGRGGECALVGKGGGLAARRRADPLLQTATVGPIRGEQFSKGHVKIDGIKTNKSILGFMDDMEPKALMSAIPSMLGIDTMRYRSSADFHKELERAFECGGNRTINDGAKKHHRSSARTKIHHPLLGSIDFSDAIRSEPMEHSIAFPPCDGSSRLEAAREEDSGDAILLRHLNLARKTGHGMRIPPSFCEFPFPETESPGDGLASYDDGEPTAQSKEPPSPECISGGRGDGNVLNDGGADKQVEQPSLSDRLPSKYQGKIKIVSERGATIREIWDIDKSRHVIGKLHAGDERYFVEKRNLDPPPISVGDSDSESDDECVAVFRYKIALTQADCGASAQFEMDNAGPLVGWISDRGRLADDAYTILKEI